MADGRQLHQVDEVVDCGQTGESELREARDDRVGDRLILVDGDRWIAIRCHALYWERVGRERRALRCLALSFPSSYRVSRGRSMNRRYRVGGAVQDAGPVRPVAGRCGPSIRDSRLPQTAVFGPVAGPTFRKSRSREGATPVEFRKTP